MSEQITKDLGGITAYAAAVAAGYTGTKAQFETLMASYATVAQNAAASATAANGSAEDAEAFADGQRDGVDVGSTDPAYHNNAKYYAEQAETYADSIDPDKIESHIDAAYIKETASGSIATFSDGAPAPVRDLVAEIVPIQSGSGDPSPDNVRAISGCTECNVGVCGVNVLPTPDPDYTSLKGITMAIGDDGTLTLDGTATNTTYIRGKFVSPLPTGDYSFAMFNPVADSNIKISLRPENYDSGSVGGWHTMNSINDAFAFTTVAPAYYWQIQIDTGVTLNNFKLSPMMAVGSQVPTTYEPYNADSTTHTISFASAGTVYGGSIDVTTGVLTVDSAEVDLGVLTWTNRGTYFDAGFSAYSPITPISDSSPLDAICECYKPSYLNDAANYIITMNIAGTTIYTRDGSKSAMTGDEYKTALSGKKLVFKLATQQTYQLTPTEVKTLLGNNNIWADTGDVTVEYVADTKTFIENLVNA